MNGPDFEEVARHAKADADDAPRAWAEPDLSLLTNDRGDVPALPLQVFPPLWREWLVQSAEGAGAPVDYVAQGLLAAVAGVTGCGVFAVATPSWCEPLVLWQAAVGAPSMGKTPALRVARDLVDRVESEARLGDESRQRDHETKIAAAKVATDRWEDEVEAAVKKGFPPPQKPAGASLVEPFIPIQFVVADATIESIVDVVRGNPRGVILWGDELTALLVNLSRYSGGSDRPFWLERWSAGSATVNRKGRPPVHLSRLGASIVGGIQPDRLAEICAGADDGMAGRFLYSWPNRPPYKPLRERRDGFDDRALARLRRIAGISGDAENPLMLKLDDAALDALNEFCAEHHGEAGDYEGLEAGWFGKGRGYVLRLAGVLTLLEWSEGNTLSPPRAINAKTVKRAAGLWANYFWPVARAIFSSTGKTVADKQDRRAALWFKQANSEIASVEDLRVNAFRRKLTAEQIEGVIKRLVALGILRPASTAPTGPGRPPGRWEVNAALHAAKPKATDA